jgi:hypothetical protein
MRDTCPIREQACQVWRLWWEQIDMPYASADTPEPRSNVPVDSMASQLLAASHLPTFLPDLTLPAKTLPCLGQQRTSRAAHALAKADPLENH